MITTVAALLAQSAKKCQKTKKNTKFPPQNPQKSNLGSYPLNPLCKNSSWISPLVQTISL